MGQSSFSGNAMTRSSSKLTTAVFGLLLGVALSACEPLSREPSYLLAGGMEGTWEIAHRNAHGASIPDGLDSFTLKLAPGFADSTSADWLTGTLVDGRGRQAAFSLAMSCDLGPCLIVREASWAGGAPASMGIMPMVNGDRDDDTLLIFFEKASDGAAYPHDYERL